ncbi:MAG: hypothetical protein IKH88_01370 [Prevotella sp.]|nr:hypothetical protein [Prevotella sp.]
MKSFITTLFLLLAMTCNVMAGELSGPKSNEVQEVTGPFTIIITGNGVIGRDGPGGVDTGVRFYKGQKLTCYGLEKGWYKVKYGNGVRWVSSEYAKVESTTSATITYVVITGNRVIGRTSPAGAATSYRFNRGDKLPYLGKQGSWFNVEYDGKSLWVSSAYSYVQ